jgi:hypothetical protein
MGRRMVLWYKNVGRMSDMPTNFDRYLGKELGINSEAKDFRAYTRLNLMLPLNKLSANNMDFCR